MISIALHILAAATVSTGLTTHTPSKNLSPGQTNDGFSVLALGADFPRTAKPRAQELVADSNNQQSLSLKDQHDSAKLELMDRRSMVKSAGVQIPPDLDAQVLAALRLSPSGTDALNAAIAEVRRLSQRMHSLAAGNSK